MLTFSNNPFLYWLFSYSFCWLVLAITLFRPRMSSWVFMVLNVVMLLLLRLPSIVYNEEISVDKSQMIAHAITLKVDPIYFRSVDGTTGGPLSSYFLVLPILLGFPPNYTVARMCACMLISLSLIFSLHTCSLWFGRMAARLSIIANRIYVGANTEPRFFKL